MKATSKQKCVIRYRGFLLFEQTNLTWKVQPERSPILLMPFRTKVCSLKEVKEIIDIKLLTEQITYKAA